MKKFIPPSFIRKVAPQDVQEPPRKKIKHASEPHQFQHSSKVDILEPSKRRQYPSTGPQRKPLLTITSLNPSHVSPSEASQNSYYTVCWRKPSNKKHKTWDGDGILSVNGNEVSLQDPDGKIISRGKTKLVSVSPGDILSVGGKECQIEGILASDDFRAGRPFLSSMTKGSTTTALALDKTVRCQFKNPLKNATATVAKSTYTQSEPRHCPNAANALVLSRPSKISSQVVDVVVDPFLSQFLRPHQREGVSFLYDCLMRFKNYEGSGAILADEMGLGKTLQTITLIWTLLKQNCYANQGTLAQKVLIVCPVTLINNWKREFRKWLGQDRIGVFVVDSKANIRDFICGKIYHVMIIGYERLRILQDSDELSKASFDLVVCDEGHKLKSANNKSAQAIRALKTTRRIILSGTPMQNDLGEFYVMIDFVNPGLLGTYQAFKKVFENPIVKARQPEASSRDRELGKARSDELAKITEMFILRRTASVLSKYLPPKSEFVVFCRPTATQIALHEAMITSADAKACFRDSNSASQLRTIMRLQKNCNSPSLLGLGTANQKESKITQLEGEDLDLKASIQNTLHRCVVNARSGKMLVLEKFVLKLIKTKEKVVLVSQFTQTLDMLQAMLASHQLSFCRLDGSTPAKKRQSLVDKFNRTTASECFSFLLSSKSGGCGLNLIGASRLILFDSDWNPSNDLQAMARIHRDGQKKPVFIYRLLTTGMIDEKIFQRQVSKQGLSDSLIDAKSSGASFSLEELRDLFKYDHQTSCMTHDLLNCSCAHDGQNQLMNCESDDEAASEEVIRAEPTWKRASQVSPEDVLRKDIARNNMKALRTYDHIGGSLADDQMDILQQVLCDSVLAETIAQSRGKPGEVSYCFMKNTALAEPIPETVAETTIQEA